MILLPFAVQTAMIRSMGAEYNGLKGVFNSILQVLSLAELGVGSALVFGMYKPIADDDIEAVCALLGLYKKIYRWIGVFILVAGCLILPFLPYLIKGSYPPQVNLTALFFLYLINTILSYWLYAYKSSLFHAFQRYDVINYISLVTQGLCYLVQIFILVKFHNYYFYVGAAILATVGNNVLISYQADRMFPQYQCRGTVSGEFITDLKNKVKGLLITKLCNISRNSLDNLFLSAFFGLRLTGMYNNYYYIMTSVSGMLSILSGSLLAGVGNSIASEPVEKNYEDMRKLNFIYMLMSGWGAVFMVCLYQPFMELWVGKSFLMPDSVPVLFTLYFYIMKMGDIRAVYSDANGLWWENRYRTMIETVLNLVLNYLLVQAWGVEGVVIATILPLFLFGFIGSSAVLFREYFQSGLPQFLKEHAVYFGVTFFVCCVAYGICGKVACGGIEGFLMRVAVCMFLPPALFYLIYHKQKIFQISVQWLLLRIRG